MELTGKIGSLIGKKGGQVWSVESTASVYDAIVMMAEKGVGALPVIDQGKLLGIVSERDYARKIILMGRSSRTTTVGEIMVSPPITVTADCSVDEAMRTMTQHRVRHLPVLNRSGRALGIVSIGDCVKWVITSHEKTIEQLHSYIAGQF